MSERHAIGRVTIGVCALGWSLLSPQPAAANGAFPSASQLIADPSDADHLVLRSTFGLLVTRDRGASWEWLCEAGLLYKDVEPAMAVLPGGIILLAVPGGISRGDAAGCDFELAQGIAATVYDLARIPSETDGAVAISAEGTDAQLWRSTDAGASFVAVGDVISGFIPATVDVATTDRNVIYASGLSGTAGSLLRSADGGKSFERYPVPTTTTARRPYIAAVDPRDADTVYVRLDAQGVSPLEVTHDGGKTFSAPLTTVVSLYGFALSPDGKTVIASNDYDGTFRASTSDLVFEKIACGGPKCLSFSESGLFGCGDQQVDGFIVGRSDDLGATFQRVVDLTCVAGPVSCDPATSAGAACPALWPDVETQIGATACSPPDVEPYTGCFASAGEAGTGASASGKADAGASASGGSGTGGGASGASGGEGGSGKSTPERSGCGCRVERRGQERWLWVSAAVVALVGWGRLRRRARSNGRGVKP